MTPMKHIVLAASFAVTLATTAQAAAPVAKPDKIVVCAACHGENGVSTQPIYPNLAGQQETYIEHALHAYKGGVERKNPIMGAQAATLSDADIKQLAKWFAQQAPVVYTPDLETPEGKK
jgi:cytochrome c553